MPAQAGFVLRMKILPAAGYVQCGGPYSILQAFSYDCNRGYRHAFPRDLLSNCEWLLGWSRGSRSEPRTEASDRQAEGKPGLQRTVTPCMSGTGRGQGK